MDSLASTGGSSAISGIARLQHGLAFRGGWFGTRIKPRFQSWIRAGNRFERQVRGRDGTLRGLRGRQDLLMPLHLQLRNLAFDLGFELVRGAAELIQRLSYLARNLRQLLRPKNDQSQKKQEDCLREAHATHHTAPPPWRQRRGRDLTTA